MNNAEFCRFPPRNCFFQIRVTNIMFAKYTCTSNPYTAFLNQLYIKSRRTSIFFPYFKVEVKTLILKAKWKSLILRALSSCKRFLYIVWSLKACYLGCICRKKARLNFIITEYEYFCMSLRQAHPAKWYLLLCYGP